MSVRVTIVSVLFHSERFLPRFLPNIAAQTALPACEWLCVLPEQVSEAARALLAPWQERLGDRLELVLVREDPGLYALWNSCIARARGEYVTNANPDDLRAPRHIAACMELLDARPEVEVCATRIGYTADASEPWDDHTWPAAWVAPLSGSFGAADLFERDAAGRPTGSRNIPHCMPVWRRSLHQRFGWFDEPGFGPSADWEFWLRCLGGGGGRGWLLPEVLGQYYLNPQSYWRANARAAEFDDRILRTYRHLAGAEPGVAEPASTPAAMLKPATPTPAATPTPMPVTPALRPGLLAQANDLARQGRHAEAGALYAQCCAAMPAFAPAWRNHLLTLAALDDGDAFDAALARFAVQFDAGTPERQRLLLVLPPPWRERASAALAA